MKQENKALKLFMTLVMAGVGLLFISPLLWMISASLKPEHEVFTYPIRWIPQQWNAAENYRMVWVDSSFYLYYWNSFKVAGLTTLVSITSSCMAAYAFAKIRFKGRHLLFILILAIYMIPHQAVLVPQFIIFRWLNLYDTHLGLILLGSFSVLGTFMLRQFYLGIHEEYIESAKLDGAGQLRTFLWIATPLVRPAIVTYAILRFIWTWNDYQGPLIFLKSQALYTLQIGIHSFADVNGDIYSLMMAASVSAIIPLIALFIIGQKQVIEGIAAGGVKG